jgi:hypothetical protein
MTWVRRAGAPAHVCKPPRWDGYVTSPAGELGDLWRCDDCRELWRVGRSCAACDAFGHSSHGGQCMVGLAWLPATLWQRIRNRRNR